MRTARPSFYVTKTCFSVSLNGSILSSLNINSGSVSTKKVSIWLWKVLCAERLESEPELHPTSLADSSALLSLKMTICCAQRGAFAKKYTKWESSWIVWREAALNTTFFQLTEACHGIATGWQPFHPCAPTPHAKIQKPFRNKKFKNTRIKLSYYSVWSITIWFQPLAISKQRTI